MKRFAFPFILALGLMAMDAYAQSGSRGSSGGGVASGSVRTTPGRPLFKNQTGRSATVADRIWTDLSGKHRIEGTMVANTNGVVSIRRKDGRVIRINLQRLSRNDQLYVTKTKLR